MPTPREIKRRIGSIRNTQKITKAMEMVSSVKLRKAKAQILNARPYSEKLAAMAAQLRKSHASSMSPLLVSRNVKKIGLVLVSSDKGLCGGFNANVVKKGLEFMRENSDKEIVLTLVGKKVVETYRHKNIEASEKYTDIFFKPDYSGAIKISTKLLSDFRAHNIDEVVIVYNEFKSSASQKIKVETLLPVPKIESGQTVNADYIFEPEGKECLDVLLSKYFVFQIWRIILESYAGEQGARMAAMNGASKNAGELIAKFTLFYNKARQASITNELLEVVSGAEALR
ncbi:MAG TPA: ATP synthase F1 subunit gamma [Fibrobacteres bacterium]|jgi:F-type H+-transporting ATPase subunit gamma|nr:ATP synthase F1 subunit gamma [Fibrobacterota bacterium]